MSHPLLLVELELLLLALVLVRIHPGLVERVRRWFDNGPALPWYAIAGIALAAHLVAWPVLRPALPGLPEEFSNLLAADTLSQGRLSNPPHPLRTHFEAPFVSQSPTYGSTLPPGDGFLFALGQLAGNPVAGAWIGTALFCGALCWALAGWMPASCATAASLLAILRLGVFSPWANTFQGGALAALAGCLLWGAAGRLRERARPSDCIVMVAGLAVLMLTRPYEAIWLGAAAIAVVALSKRLTIGILAPVTFCFPAGLMLAFFKGWLPPAEANAGALEKLGTFWMLLVGPALTIPLAVFAFASSRGRFAYGLPGLGAALVFAGVMISPGPGSPAAWAPLTASLFVALLDGCRLLLEQRPRLAVACLLASAAVVPARAAVWLGWLEFETFPPGKAVPWHAAELHPLRRRAGVIRELRRVGGNHVVLVRYNQGHPNWEEYVYNGANIDAGDIIWARELPDPLANVSLVQAYAGRRIWLWRVDESDVIEPHPLGSFQGQPPQR